MKGLFGVVDGVYQCNLDRSNELNERKHKNKTVLYIYRFNLLR